MAGPLFAANRQGLSYVSCSTCMDEVEGYDVVALQETYLLEKDKDLIKKEWRCCFYLSEGTTHGKELLTSFNISFDVNEISEVFTTDRIIISPINTNGEQIFINNVYGTTTDQDKF